MSSHEHTPVHTHCQNCETELTGPYCAKCGQKDFEFHQSFGHVVHEALETWFHVDHSFLRGFYLLLFKPGLMTREFNEGKRARHVPPLRFYLVISLLFFLIIPPHDAGGGIQLDEQSRAELAALGNAPETASTVAEPGAKAEEADDAREAAAESDFEKAMLEGVTDLAKDPSKFWQNFLKAVPKALLVCLPIFALITRVIYFRFGWVYLQHLILSVHLHTFVFLWWMMAYGWTRLIGLWSEGIGDLVGFVASLYIFYAFYSALRRCFGGSRRRTLVLGTLAGAAYLFVLVLAFGITAAVSLAL